MADHGLMDAGAADPNHGQLFDTRQMPTRSPEARTHAANAPQPQVAVRPSSGKGNLDLPLGGAPGFMPGLNKKQKIRAIESVGQELQSPTPVRDIMENRQAAGTRAGKPAPWYSGVDEQGRHDLSIPGDANVAIRGAAARQGVSDGAMTRAVANTSPRTRWDTGHPSNQGHRMDNLDAAEGVIDATKTLQAVDMADDKTIDEVTQDSSVVGSALPKMGAKAGKQFRDQGNDTTKPIEMKARTSQKVPNFEQSLHLTHVDPQVRKNAAMSWTSDTHDQSIAGVSEKYMDRVGSYELQAMTGTRTAFKNRELPPNEQAREWVGQRGGTQHIEQEGFFEAHRGGLRPRTEAMPPSTASLTESMRNSSRNRKRASTAERMGLEF